MLIKRNVLWPPKQSHEVALSIRLKSQLSASDLDHLHKNIEAAVSGEQSPLWPALAKSVRLFPNRMCAKITQEALGPYIAAQMTRHLDTKTAVGIGKHFSPQFLAEAMGHIDPAESAALLSKMPMSNIKKSVMYLLAEQQFEDLGTILEHLPKDKMFGLVKEIESPRALINIANAMSHKARFADVVVQLKDEQIYPLIEMASEMEMWKPVLEVCSHMSSKHQARMSTLAQEFDWEDANYFSNLASELGLSDDLQVLLSGETVRESHLRLGRFMPWKVKGF